MVQPFRFIALTWSSATGKDISPMQFEKSQGKRDVPQGKNQDTINRKKRSTKQTKVIGFFTQTYLAIQCP